MNWNGNNDRWVIMWESVSDKGERSHNEDYLGYAKKQDAYCFVLADGLGGHGRGEEASKHVVKTILDVFQEEYPRNDFLQGAFSKAQDALLQKQKEEGAVAGMMTTVTCLLVEKEYVQWGFCGDSRLYYFDRKRLKCRTIDHSVPQMLVLSGQLKEKQIRFHEDRNRLLRVIGVQSDKTIYEVLPPVTRRRNQQFLLCTDGFWEYILEKDMVKFLQKAESPQIWLESMLQMVLKNGIGKGMDNYSAIAVWI